MKRIRKAVIVLIVLGLISGLVVLLWNGFFNWGWKLPLSDKLLTATYSNIDDLHELDQFIVVEASDILSDNYDLLKSYCYKVNIKGSILNICAFDFPNETQALSFYKQYYRQVTGQRWNGNIAQVRIGITKCKYCVINDASVLIIETKSYTELKQFLEDYTDIFDVDIGDKIASHNNT